MHREKLEVQGYVKDDSIKLCKKKVINTYANRYETEPKLRRIASKLSVTAARNYHISRNFNDKVLGLYSMVKLDPLLYLI